MAFHADFWVVAGTAAPVIVLSSILVIREQYQIQQGVLRVIRNPMGLAHKWRSGFYSALFLYYVTLSIVLLQAGTLLASLASLEKQENIWSPKLVGALQVLSLLGLFISTLGLVSDKNWIERLDRETDSQPPSQKISPHPFHKPQSNALGRAGRYRSAHQITNARMAKRAPQTKNKNLP